jgi:hypothetical protein
MAHRRPRRVSWRWLAAAIALWVALVVGGFLLVR